MTSFAPTEHSNVLGAMDPTKPIKQAKLPSQKCGYEAEDEAAVSNPHGLGASPGLSVPVEFPAPPGRAAPPGLELPDVCKLASPPGFAPFNKRVSGSDSEGRTSVDTSFLKESSESEDEEFQMDASAPCFVPSQMKVNASRFVPGSVHLESEAPSVKQRTPLQRSPKGIAYLQFAPVVSPYVADPVKVQVGKNTKGEVVRIKITKKA